MKILVTGGSGGLGRWVVRELAEAGHDVVNADRTPPRAEGDAGFRAARFVSLDVGDTGQVVGALAGCNAAVHLAAIPAPGGVPDDVLFRANTGATFTVLHACALLGVRRAVIASSVSALGMAWAPRRFHARYAPVDEAHPMLGQDPYALSKEVDERTAEMFVRRTGMTILAYRFHWIAQPGAAARQAAEVREHPESLAHGLWDYVDVRDAARACRLGLESGVEGFEAFNIIAADTLSDQPTEDLIRRHCPNTTIREPIPGTSTAWSIEKARALLQYEPRHSWRDEGTG